jgi:hypothetical protein
VALAGDDVDRRPILVTGAHRSGTTWVGKMLCLSPDAAYVHEPFNPLTSPGISGAPFERFFTYVTRENEAAYLPHLERTLRFEYQWRAQVRATRSWRDAVRAVRDAAAFERARRRRQRPVMKDPIALLSAEWLADRFGMDVLVLIRHPAGFAGSLKRLGMNYRFETMLADERLLRERLARFEPEIREQARARGDVVAQAALLWRILYTVVDEYRHRHPEWLFVRHEDLAHEPVARFEELYAGLGLRFTPAVAGKIEQFSVPGSRADPQARHSVRMESEATIASWRSRLTPEELARLHAAVADVSGRFYRDDEW